MMMMEMTKAINGRSKFPPLVIVMVIQTATVMPVNHVKPANLQINRLGISLNRERGKKVSGQVIMMRIVMMMRIATVMMSILIIMMLISAGNEEDSDASFSGILKLRHIRKCGGT